VRSLAGGPLRIRYGNTVREATPAKGSLFRWEP
jgi:hypothetical protein